MAQKHISIRTAEMLHMLCGEIADLSNFLVGVSFTVSEAKNLPVLWVNDVSVNGIAHIKSVICWHSNTSK